LYTPCESSKSNGPTCESSKSNKTTSKKPNKTKPSQKSYVHSKLKKGKKRGALLVSPLPHKKSKSIPNEHPSTLKNQSEKKSNKQLDLTSTQILNLLNSIKKINKKNMSKKLESSIAAFLADYYIAVFNPSYSVNLEKKLLTSMNKLIQDLQKK